jgi:hypothetical protein
MSYTYIVGNLSTGMERLVNWYREFMRRTEHSFRDMHRRILVLEQRQSWKGPSDEQVERALRKILAEKFCDPGSQKIDNPPGMKDGDYFVENPSMDGVVPHAIPMDLNMPDMDPEAVPSKTYRDTLDMLEGKLPGFPDLDISKPLEDEDDDEEPVAQRIKKSPPDSKHPRSPN